MALTIAGVFWHAVRFIRECRRGAVPSAQAPPVVVGVAVRGRGPDLVAARPVRRPAVAAPAVRVRVLLRRRGTGSQNARAAVRGPDAAAPRDADDRRLLREVLAVYRREALRARQRDASYLRRSRQACRGALRGARYVAGSGLAPLPFFPVYISEVVLASVFTDASSEARQKKAQ